MSCERFFHTLSVMRVPFIFLGPQGAPQYLRLTSWCHEPMELLLKCVCVCVHTWVHECACVEKQERLGGKLEAGGATFRAVTTFCYSLGPASQLVACPEVVSPLASSFPLDGKDLRPSLLPSLSERTEPVSRYLCPTLCVGSGWKKVCHCTPGQGSMRVLGPTGQRSTGWGPKQQTSISSKSWGLRSEIQMSAELVPPELQHSICLSLLGKQPYSPSGLPSVHVCPKFLFL